MSDEKIPNPYAAPTYIADEAPAPPPAEDDRPRFPASIPYIIGNEAAERFSFYGMKAILMMYMTTALMMSKETAASYGHLFNAGVYLFPFFGALLADIFWGKYKTVLTLSLVYCAGHFVLALPGSWWGEGNLHIPFFIGLSLIALGAGGIKSCVSAIVGDQFTAKNLSLMEQVYSWFYLAINVGSLFSMALTPVLYHWFGPEIAFGVPGVFMAIATLIFWMGRKVIITAPPSGARFMKELTTPAGYRAILKVSLVFVFLVVVWSIYDQTSYRWVDQAMKLDQQIFAGFSWLPEHIREYELLPAQVQAFNPFLILIFVPLFTYVLYPAINRRYKHFTLVKKMAIGMWLMAAASVFPWWIEVNILKGVNMSLGWQFVAYFVLTAGEVMVSVTALEFAYTQAPPSMKSLIMGMYLLTFALGNLLVAGINGLCESSGGTFLPGAQYYVFFLVLGVVNAFIFMFVAARYQEKTYLQDSTLDQPEGEV